MFRVAIIFFILALLSILFTATGFDGTSTDLGKNFFSVFIFLVILSFIFSWMTWKKTHRRFH